MTGGPIGVIGFSMGTYWALDLSRLRPDDVAGVVVFYGTDDADYHYVPPTSAMWGRSAFVTAIALSGSSTAVWMCMPKISSRRAMYCICSTSRR